MDAFADDLLDLKPSMDEFASRHPRQARVRGHVKTDGATHSLTHTATHKPSR